MIIRNYCYGIYKFTDKETGNIVYIGKDSHIDKKARYNEHFYPSSYDEQQINRVLQNNPERYEYCEWYHVNSIEELNQLEFDLINLYRPRFNFQHGGKGGRFFEKFSYSVAKAGINRQGNQVYKISNPDNSPLILSINQSYLKDICEKLNDKILTLDDVEEIKSNRKLSLKTKIRQSKNNSTGFFRVTKSKDKSYNQGFAWRYEYWDNGKKKKFSRIDFFKLKEEVHKRNLPWHIVDIDKAIAAVRSIVAI